MPTSVIALAAGMWASSAVTVGLGGVVGVFSAASFAGALAGGLVASTINAAFSDKPGQSPSREQAVSQNQLTMRQPIANWQYIYGRARCGGTITYMHGDAAGYLHLVITFAGHVSTEIESIYFDDVLVPIDDDPTSPTYRFAKAPPVTVPETKSFAGLARIYKSLGDEAGQPFFTEYWNGSAYVAGEGVPSNTYGLVYATAGETSGVWTDAHRQTSCTKIYVRLAGVSAFPQGLPNITAIIRGKKVYDPWTTTTKWSENSSLCQADLICDQYAGIGAVYASEIDEAALIASAHIDDEDVTRVAESATFTADAATDTITLAAGSNRPQFGYSVVPTTTGTLPAGLSSIAYYAVPSTNGTLRLATTYANAVAGTVVDITGAGTGTHTLTTTFEHRYTLNGAFEVNATPRETLGRMLTASGGKIRYIGGLWRVQSAGDVAPTITLTEDDCRAVPHISPRLSASDSANGVKGTYVSEDNLWQPSDFPPVTRKITAPNITASAQCTIVSVGTTDFTLIGAASNTVGLTFTASGAGTGTGVIDQYQGEDQGERSWREMSLPFTKSAATAQRIAKIELEKMRQQISVEWPGKFNCYRLQPGDTVSLTFALTGWTAKVFEVVQSGLTFEDSGGGMRIGCDLTLRETASAVFTWTASTDETTIDLAPDTNLPDPFAVPADVANFVVTEQADGTRTFSWDEINYSLANLSHYEIRASQTNLAWASQTIGAGNKQTLNPLNMRSPTLVAGNWYFHIKAVSTAGVSSANATPATNYPKTFYLPPNFDRALTATTIPAGWTTVIPAGQELAKSGRLVVDGRLQVEGRLVISNTNTSIGVDDAGRITGASSGNLTAISNSLITLTAAGVLQNAGGGTIDLASLTGSVTTGQLAANLVAAVQGAFVNLAAIRADLGNITAGEIVVGSTNKLWLNQGADGMLAIGGTTKASAPFRVNTAGVLTATSGTVGGWTLGSTTLTAAGLTIDSAGTLRYGKGSLGSASAGWYLGTDGFAVGAASDASVLRYTASSGAFDFIGTVSGRSTLTLANSIDGSGNVVTDIVNARLDTSAKSILAGFDFASSNYAGALKAGSITWNATTGAITGGSGVVIHKGGILGAAAGVATFTLDAATGAATFAGLLSAPSGTLGAISAGTITGATITGGTMQTASGTGKRIVIDGSTNTLKMYDAGNNAVLIAEAGAAAGVPPHLQIGDQSIDVAPLSLRVGVGTSGGASAPADHGARGHIRFWPVDATPTGALAAPNRELAAVTDHLEYYTGAAWRKLVYSDSPTLTGAVAVDNIAFGGGTALDTFVVGTWTPTIAGGGGTDTLLTATYVRVNKHFWGTIRFTSTSNARLNFTLPSGTVINDSSSCGTWIYRTSAGTINSHGAVMVEATGPKIHTDVLTASAAGVGEIFVIDVEWDIA